MRTSVSLPEELASYVGEVSSQVGENDAQAIRDTIRHARQLEERVDDLEATVSEQRERIDGLETDVDRLQREKQQILDQREEHTELVRAVESQQSLEERRAQAGLATRAKWWLFGMDDDE
jgi:chromosome segregation ATPase